MNKMIKLIISKNLIKKGENKYNFRIKYHKINIIFRSHKKNYQILLNKRVINKKYHNYNKKIINN